MATSPFGVGTLVATLRRYRHRRRVARRLSARGCLILMYHRVTTVPRDPWSLCVSPDRFAEQLDVLRRRARVMPFESLAASLSVGQLPKRAVAITFDDGYADNLEVAAPLLERAALPATVFVVAGQIDRPREFWWDELEQCLFLPVTLPPRLRLDVPGCQLDVALGEPLDTDTRLQLYLQLWRRLLRLDQSQQDRVLDELGCWSGQTVGVRDSHRTLDTAALARLARSEGISIGAHTVSHPHLPSLSRQRQHSEMGNSKRILEQTLDAAVATLSYPYGAIQNGTVRCARRAGFSAACTTVPALVTSRSDPLALPRLAVENWSGEAFERELGNWLAPS